MRLVKWSEHGLGHLLSPWDAGRGDRTWMRVAWEAIVLDALGELVCSPPFGDVPAMVRVTATSPFLLRPFAALNAVRDVSDRIRPFNFLISPVVAPFGHPEGVDPTRFRPVASWEADSRRWMQHTYLDVYSGQAYSITTVDDFGASGSVVVRTIRDVLADYARHPEAKSIGTTGLMARRAVTAIGPALIGKESNKLEEREMGFIQRLAEVLVEYRKLGDPWDDYVRPVLHEIPASVLAEATGLSERSIKRLRNGHARPRADHEWQLRLLAAEYARKTLVLAGHHAPRDDAAALAALAQLRIEP